MRSDFIGLCRETILPLIGHESLPSMSVGQPRSVKPSAAHLRPEKLSVYIKSPAPLFVWTVTSQACSIGRTHSR
jgi:hypothetical protein